MANLGNPGAIAAKWARNAGSTTAQQNYRDGIAAVRENPMAKAAAAADLWHARVSDQSAKDRFVSGCQRKSMDQWRSAATNKGASNYITGIKEGAANYQSFIADYAPIAQQAKDAANALPKGGPAEGDARYAAAIAVLRSYKRRR